MLAYRAIYIVEDDSEERWLPFERSVVSWQTVPGDPAADIDVFKEPREAAMVLSGDIGDDRLVPASSLVGFVAIVDPETPVHEIVHLCRQYVEDITGREDEDGETPAAHKPN